MTADRRMLDDGGRMTVPTRYIALLRKDAGSDYGIDVPDFPGCATAGTTPEEALTMAAEALDLHTQDMNDLPAPSSLDEIMSDSHNADAIACTVALPGPRLGRRRLNVLAGARGAVGPRDEREDDG